MTTIRSGWTRGGGASLAVTLAPSVAGSDDRSATITDRGQAFGTTGLYIGTYGPQDTVADTEVFSGTVPSVLLGADHTQAVKTVPFDGTVSAVKYTPASTITGADTNSRTVTLVNTGQTGSGNTVVATVAFTNGVNAAGSAAKTITLSGTAANLKVKKGDQLKWVSTHVGNGIADPGGSVAVTVSATYKDV
jgi:hypothetical protein